MGSTRDSEMSPEGDAPGMSTPAGTPTTGAAAVSGPSAGAPEAGAPEAGAGRPLPPLPPMSAPVTVPSEAVKAPASASGQVWAAAPIGSSPAPPADAAAIPWVGLLALVAGVLAVGGVFAPFVSSSGVDAALIDAQWSATAALCAGALLLVAGAVALVDRRGAAVAGGAALIFLGIAGINVRSAAALVDLSSGFGGGTAFGAGFYLWLAAAAASVVLVVVALATLGAPRGAPWLYLVAAAGPLLLVVGVLAPPDGFGFGFGEMVFAGDVGQDAAMVVLLGGLVVASAALLAARSPASALFALAVTGPWVASWFVFAVDGTSGGLPVPFVQTPALAALAVGLTSVAWFGALWGVGAAGAAAGTAAGAGTAVGAGVAPGLAMAQVITIVICGGTVLASAAGAAAAEPSGYSNGGTIDYAYGAGGYDATEGATDTYDDPYPTEPATDDYYAEDSGGATDTYDAPSTDDGNTYDTEVCVEVECQDGGEAPAATGHDDRYDDSVLTNVVCPADIAVDMNAAGGDAGYLQARYTAGNFVIHICTGPGGSIYHGQNVTNTDKIVLPATGDVYSGFTAVNGTYTYDIDQYSLVIRRSGSLLQDTPVATYEEYD